MTWKLAFQWVTKFIESPSLIFNINSALTYFCFQTGSMVIQELHQYVYDVIYLYLCMIYTLKFSYSTRLEIKKTSVIDVIVFMEYFSVFTVYCQQYHTKVSLLNSYSFKTKQCEWQHMHVCILTC